MYAVDLSLTCIECSTKSRKQSDITVLCLRAHGQHPPLCSDVGQKCSLHVIVADCKAECLVVVVKLCNTECVWINDCSSNF